MKKQNKWLAGLSLLVLAGIIVGCGSVAATMTQLPKVLHQTKRSQSNN